MRVAVLVTGVAGADVDVVRGRAPNQGRGRRRAAVVVVRRGAVAVVRHRAGGHDPTRAW